MAQEENRYCYWDIRSEFDEIVIVGYLVLFTILMGFIGRTCFLSRRSSFNSCTVFGVYFFLIAWYVTYLASYIYGILIFNNFKGNLKQNMSFEQLTYHSTIFQFMDFFPVFLLLGCLFFVSSLLYSQILAGAQQQGLNITKDQKIFKRFLIFYQLLRLLSLIPNFQLLIIGQNDKDEGAKNEQLIICSTIYLIYYFFDFFICNIVVWIVMSAMRANGQALGLNEQQRSRLRRHTLSLQIIILIRLVFRLIFTIFMGIDLNKQDCRDKSQIRSYLYILFGQFIFHCLPVIVIICIFRIKRKRTESDGGIYNRLGDQP